MPFVMKKAVFDAAVVSSITYSSETWLSNNIKSIEGKYNMMVRLLLSVRPKTPINLCLIEAGIEPLRHIIKKKRALYLQQKFRDVDMEQPFHQIHNICREANAPAAAFMANAIRYNRQSEIGEITDQVRTQEGTKFVTYTVLQGFS